MGTGSLALVTGSLTFTGAEDLSTGTFTEAITGQLCRRHGQVDDR